MEAAWRDIPRNRDERRGAEPIAGSYFIKHGYVERPEPRYDDLSAVGTNWQASVYERAAAAAASLAAKRIIDVGCGDGRNLALLGHTPIVGLDYGPNLVAARTAYPDAEFIEIDLEADAAALPVETAGAVVICADVIEHLRRPEKLLERLRAALEDDAHLVLLSTPDRDVWWGRDHNGPPPNEGHVREWNRTEFSALLAACRFTGRIELVQSNDVGPERKTILATLDAVRAE
jgi:SAM-dependent methyltransferase